MLHGRQAMHKGSCISSFGMSEHRMARIHLALIDKSIDHFCGVYWGSFLCQSTITKQFTACTNIPSTNNHQSLKNSFQFECTRILERNGLKKIQWTTHSPISSLKVTRSLRFWRITDSGTCLFLFYNDNVLLFYTYSFLKITCSSALFTRRIQLH